MSNAPDNAQTYHPRPSVAADGGDEDANWISLKGGIDRSPDRAGRRSDHRDPEEIIETVELVRPSLPDSVVDVLARLARGETPATLADEGLIVTGLAQSTLSVSDIRARGTDADGGPDRGALAEVADRHDLDLLVTDGLGPDEECAHDGHDAYVHQPDPHPPEDDDYCSKRCYARARARDIVDWFINRHRFCATCFRRLRYVTPPRAEHKWGGTSKNRHLNDQEVTKEAHIGFAASTDETRDVVGTRPAREREEYVPGADETRRATIERDTTGCECGTTSHRQRRWPLSKQKTIAAAKRLREHLDDLRSAWLVGSRSKVERARAWKCSGELLLYAVGHLKTQPEQQFHERRVFETALAAALAAPNYTLEE